MEDPIDDSDVENGYDWRKTVGDLGDRAQKLVREDPTKAIGVAAVAGLLLTIFPLGRVLGALVRLTFALARPLLLALGALKIYEEFEKKQKP